MPPVIVTYVSGRSGINSITPLIMGLTIAPAMTAPPVKITNARGERGRIQDVGSKLSRQSIFFRGDVEMCRAGVMLGLASVHPADRSWLRF